MNDRRKMHIGDWLNVIAFLGIGFFLGLALDRLLLLQGALFWITAIGIPILVWAVIAATNVFNGLIDRIFPSGIKPARDPRTDERKPLAVLLSVPVGIVVGFAGGHFGLAELFLS